MSRMKNLLADDDRSDLLKLMSDIARARDEYREELYRERETKHELLTALREMLIACEKGIPTVSQITAVRKAIKNAEG